MASLVLACNRCGVSATHRLYRVRAWFTLFFVRAVPLGHGRYTMQCASCGSETPTDRADAERLAANATELEHQHQHQHQQHRTQQTQQTLTPTEGDLPTPPA